MPTINILEVAYLHFSKCIIPETVQFKRTAYTSADHRDGSKEMPGTTADSSTVKKEANFHATLKQYIQGGRK